jgi:hypothetical protein
MTRDKELTDEEKQLMSVKGIYPKELGFARLFYAALTID